jgi:hypothetical protein
MKSYMRAIVWVAIPLRLRHPIPISVPLLLNGILFNPAHHQKNGIYLLAGHEDYGRDIW